EHGRRDSGSAFDGRRRPPALLASHRDAAQIDHRVFDDASAHPLGRASRPLPRPLLHPSRHAEQVDGALRRLRQFPVPVQARDVLDWWSANPASPPPPPSSSKGSSASSSRTSCTTSRAEASASGGACCWCPG